MSFFADICPAFKEPYTDSTPGADRNIFASPAVPAKQRTNDLMHKELRPCPKYTQSILTCLRRECVLRTKADKRLVRFQLDSLESREIHFRFRFGSVPDTILPICTNRFFPV